MPDSLSLGVATGLLVVLSDEQETVKYEVTLTPTLDAARKQLIGIAEDLAHRQLEMGLKEIDPKEYVKELVHDGMMEACYEWARGVPFVSITKLTGNVAQHFILPSRIVKRSNGICLCCTCDLTLLFFPADRCF